ncbi:TlpA disulfide reductase family protein [Mangrovimonas sp. YM274]|uniref:TlpA family protein disulfide reductase n=1 Tax=Mangrovimonas sp. YM274 TaxID=3070660 RepID=UPI0027DE82F8|nr:TlpA disulfide reductase family protein [Mangrovimonas sp. YM274]WMI68714.1 TlpA disulfide reductase family protein [Mangrovimonas sp. YM274]
MKTLAHLLLFLPTVLIAQHKVSGKFTPAKDYTYALLYEATPTGTNFVDKSEIEEDGSFHIQLESSVKPGIYKIVYALPPEEYNFDLIYNGKEDVALNFSIEKGLEFTASNENKLWSSYTKSMELVNMAISNFYSQESADHEAYKDIFKTLEDTQKGFEDASKGTMAHTFITANAPYIPQSFEDLSTYSNNLKRTYFKHVNFSNPLLLSSDFLNDRVLAYVFGMAAGSDNAIYKANVDALMDTMKEADPMVRTSLLQTVWDRFTIMENTEVANYIIDTYLEDLAKKTNNGELSRAIINYKKNAVGNKAQNFDMTIQKDGKEVSTTLYDLDIADRYLVIFWSSTCSHCLAELPQVKTIIPNDMQVIAIGLENNSKTWDSEKLKYPNFIHVLALGKWDNKLAEDYNVTGTPSYFLLDKNKIITSKPYDIEELKEGLK